MIPRFKAFTKQYGMVDVLEINFGFKMIEFHIYLDKAPHAKTDYIENIELLQSTGVKDKHGVEIYEGDVVKHDPVPNPFLSNNHFEIIQARSGEWRIDNYRGGSVLAFSNHIVEVVGNKYEHPHLLKE